MTGSDPWAGLTHDPRLPQHAHLRSAQRDRDAVAQVLAEAYADGRLDREEFDARSTALATSKTLGELPGFLSDLLAPSPPGAASGLPVPLGGPGALAHPDLYARAVARFERERRNALWTLVWVSAACTAYWGVNAWEDGRWDPGFYWPMFVVLALVLNLGKVVLERSSRIADEVRRLEAKELKRARRLAARQQPKALGPGHSGQPGQPGSQPGAQPSSRPKQRDDSSPQ